MEIERKRKLWTKDQKREIVEETLKPDRSVAAVARAHEVNANQVHWWRHLYRQGLLKSEVDQTTLLPVKVLAGLPEGRRKGAAKTAQGYIDIDLGHARVRIEGAADPDCIRAALQGLSR